MYFSNQTLADKFFEVLQDTRNKEVTPQEEGGKWVLHFHAAYPHTDGIRCEYETKDQALKDKIFLFLAFIAIENDLSHLEAYLKKQSFLSESDVMRMYSIYISKSHKNPQNVANIISDFVNTMGNDEEIKECAAYLNKQHNTLEQKIMQLFLHFVEGMAREHFIDARNESANKIAKKIMALKENDWDFKLPLI